MDTAMDLPVAIIRYFLMYALAGAVIIIALCGVGLLDHKIVMKAISDQFK